MKKPYDVNLIADYIIIRLNSDEKLNLINLKLQKLLYYVQAWSLGINQERFLKCDFEAWAHGPVSRVLYNRFKDTKNLYSFINEADVINKNPETKILNDDIDFINFILDNYAGFRVLSKIYSNSNVSRNLLLYSPLWNVSFFTSAS